MATSMKTVATRPDRRFVRTGVASRGWKAPSRRVKKPPSAAAMACMRSLTISQALPWSIAIQLPAIIIGWIVGNLLGALAAFKGGWLDRGAFIGSLFLSSVPPFALAIILLFVIGAQLGILVSGPRALEALRRIDTVVLDKTGTLTTGELRVAAIDCPDGYEEDTLLALAGSIEQHSTHPIARAIVSAANQRGLALCEATAVQEKPGHGLSATIDEQEIVVGRSNWLEERRISAPAVDQRFSGLSALLVGVNGSYAGVIFLSDTLRPEARARRRHCVPMALSISRS